MFEKVLNSGKVYLSLYDFLMGTKYQGVRNFAEVLNDL